jgi:DNA-binding transcriptional MerR regulator
VSVVREFLLTSEVAELLRADVRTLKRWRAAGVGPAFITISAGRILYSRAAVYQWLEERTTQTKGETE